MKKVKQNKRKKVIYLLRYLGRNKSLMKSLFYKFRFLNIMRNWYEHKVKRVRLSSRPYMLQIEPIMGCNLKCPLCPVGDGSIKRKSGLMSLSNYKVIIDKLSPYIVSVSLWLWGEPLLNPEIGEIISYTNKRKIHTILATNAYFLNEGICRDILNSNLSHLRISLDGASEETYLRYRRGGDFNKVLDNIKYLVRLKKSKRSDLYVELQFIVMKHNTHEISGIKRIHKELGTDYLSLKTLKAEKEESKTEFLPDDLGLTRYGGSKGINSCKLLWNTLTVNYDGSCVLCCLDSDNELVLGNIQTQGLSSVWNSRLYVGSRERILNNEPAFSKCSGCSQLEERYIQ